MHPLTTALETRNFKLLKSLLTEDVRFTSPVSPTPYQGQQMTIAILTSATELLEGLHDDGEIVTADWHVLRFHARIGEHGLEGCHFLKFSASRQIQEMTTMMRPLPAATAFYEGMEAYRLRLTGEISVHPS